METVAVRMTASSTESVQRPPSVPPPSTMARTIQRPSMYFRHSALIGRTIPPFDFKAVEDDTPCVEIKPAVEDQARMQFDALGGTRAEIEIGRDDSVAISPGLDIQPGDLAGRRETAQRPVKAARQDKARRRNI